MVNLRRMEVQSESWQPGDGSKLQAVFNEQRKKESAFPNLSYFLAAPNKQVASARTTFRSGAPIEGTRTRDAVLLRLHRRTFTPCKLYPWSGCGAGFKESHVWQPMRTRGEPWNLKLSFTLAGEDDGLIPRHTAVPPSLTSIDVEGEKERDRREAHRRSNPVGARCNAEQASHKRNSSIPKSQIPRYLR
jgi:hypothetical protein